MQNYIRNPRSVEEGKINENEAPKTLKFDIQFLEFGFFLELFDLFWANAFIK